MTVQSEPVDDVFRTASDNTNLVTELRGVR